MDQTPEYPQESGYAEPESHFTMTLPFGQRETVGRASWSPLHHGGFERVKVMVKVAGPARRLAQSDLRKASHLICLRAASPRDSIPAQAGKFKGQMMPFARDDT